MALHKVIIKATIIMDEMDGTAEESALVALDIATKALEDVFAHGGEAAEFAGHKFGRDDIELEVESAEEIEG